MGFSQEMYGCDELGSRSFRGALTDWCRFGTLNRKYDPLSLLATKDKSMMCSSMLMQPESFPAAMTDKSVFGRILCKGESIKERQA